MLVFVVVSEVGELMLSSVMFDPFSGDSRIVLGDAVLDFIDQNKPFTIESVPQADLERQDCSVKEINYFRYKNYSLIATVHLDAFHHLPPILPMEGDQPWPLRDETFDHPAQDDPGDESIEIAVKPSRKHLPKKRRVSYSYHVASLASVKFANSKPLRAEELTNRK